MSEPVTKADLESAIEAAVQSIKQYVDLRINDATQSLKDYVNHRINDAVRSVKEYVDQRTYDAETRLLRGFADYNVAIGT